MRISFQIVLDWAVPYQTSFLVVGRSAGASVSEPMANDLDTDEAKTKKNRNSTPEQTAVRCLNQTQQTDPTDKQGTHSSLIDTLTDTVIPKRAGHHVSRRSQHPGRMTRMVSNAIAQPTIQRRWGASATREAGSAHVSPSSKLEACEQLD